MFLIIDIFFVNNQENQNATNITTVLKIDWFGFGFEC
jgi:hypothetical protein